MNSEPIGPDHQLPAPRKRRGVQIVVWLAILLIFAAGFALVLNHHEDASKAAAGAGGRGRFGGTVALNIATAQKGDIGIYLDAIGTVTPVYTSSIVSQVNGIITAVNYREGQIVQKGASLIDVDDRPYLATLGEAKGTLEHDQGLLAQAKMDLDRYRDAWNRNAIPKQTLDDQEKLVQQDEGTVRLDESTVQFDQIQVDFCHIKAPITGRVGLRLVDPGNVVQSSGGTTLAVITQLQPTTVVFTIAEDSLRQLEPHLRQRGHLTVAAYDRAGKTKLGDGVLLSLDNQIDTTTGTLKGRATFPNKDNALYANQFVNTRLLEDTVRNATLIPTSAIQHNGSVAFVFVIQNDTAKMQNVKTGVTDGDTTQVTGINPGDVVANSSFDKLQNGSKVTVSKMVIPSTANGSAAP